ncbi:MAG: alpha/beta fold hydrolase [Pseudomonadota bacterium]
MRRIAVLWLCLVVVSNGYRLLSPTQPSARPDQQLLQLPERDGNRLTGERISIAFSDGGPVSERAVPILLLHGTPVASSAMRGLATALSETRRVITPDLPGFGSSLQVLADYSSITHGYYLGDFLDALNTQRVHVVAYSQGGAAAIALTDTAPDRVASLTLVSAIGVQELELFGSYTLNHAVYTGQLWLLRAARWLLPHFGYFDNAILGPGYARNLTDTDQRLLRPMLSRIEAPTLIVHGRDDGLVPYSAALEHHRLVAQSRLQTFAGGHELAYANPAMIAPSISAFINAVDAGGAASRTQASEARKRAAANEPEAFDREPLVGFALLVMCLAIIVATYVSEDLTCIAAGLLVAQGIIAFEVAVLACLIGLFTGDIALFGAGRWLGPPALRRLVSEPRLARASQWLEHRGPWVIIASRFLPGTRLPTYVAAGALHMPFWRFSAYFAIATAIWTPTLVGLAYLYGEIARQWFSQYANGGVLVLASGFIVLWLASRVGPALLSWQGRRLLFSKWQRLRRFEFWPRSAFYPPIVLYCIWLAIRHRSITLFTLANPGMPLGGLIGESKTDILTALMPSGAVAPFATLPDGAIDARMAALDAFVAEHATQYPIVLKPVRGERGTDVAIIEDREAASSYLSQHAQPTIVQCFASGEEFGVFYMRRPGHKKGMIYSITHKQPTIVTGDGGATLETLILNDPRAVCMAEFFLGEHADHLSEIIADGRQYPLSRIGTHSRGSLFTDAGTLASDALLARLDEISQHFPGFYLGRYDLITKNAQTLTTGQALTIVELNGVSAEAAHIYHPGTSVVSGWRVIARQWRFAFEIGAALRRHGWRPIGPLNLIKALVGRPAQVLPSRHE